MLPYRLNEINESVFDELCTQRTSESDTLDFKRTLPSNDEAGKEELAKDVTAMLNASGGDLVYGITEDRATGTAQSVQGIQIDNFDKESRRINQILLGWIEPRAQGIQILDVPLASGIGIVIRVPASFDGPHCIRNPNNNQRRFVIRTGKMTADMTYDQVRNAFDRTATLAERARRMIQDRIISLESYATARPIRKLPIIAAEFVPFSGVAGRLKIDIGKISRSDDWLKLTPPYASNIDKTLNVEGIVVYECRQRESQAMTHLFRDGRYECMMTCGHSYDSDKLGIWPDVASKFMRETASAIYAFANRSEISGPGLLQYALMHTSGYMLTNGENTFWGKDALSDRKHIVFPEIYIEDIAVAQNINDLVSPIIEVLWQSFGFDGPQT